MYLLINSEDRTNSSDRTTNFTIQLANTIKAVTALKLKSIGINHKIYNVSSETLNNKFVFTEIMQDSSLVHHSITLNDGHYTSSKLASELESRLNSIGTYIYSVDYSEITYKYIISSTGDFTITINGLSRFMGYSNTNTSSSHHTGDGIAKFDDQSFYYMDLSCFPKPIVSTSDIRTTFILPNTEMASEYSGLPNIVQSISATDVQLFTVYLKNKDGTELNLRGAEWWCMLELIASN